jgi:hypothetical protein
MNPAAVATGDGAAERLFPSGRSVRVKVGPGGEELEVRSPQGEVEVQILLTDTGPVVRLRGARLEVESPDVVAVNCRRLEVRAAEDVHLHSDDQVTITGRELRMRTEGDIRADGAVIRLNCEEAR